MSDRCRHTLWLLFLAWLGAAGGASAQVGVIDIEAFHEGASDTLAIVVDRAEPEITIRSPLPGSVIAGNVITVTGTVEDLVSFSAPELPGSSLFGEVRYDVRDASFVQVTSGSAPLVDGRFTIRDLVLGVGEHRIGVVVADASGNLGDAFLEIEVDPTAPEVALVRPLDGEALLVDTVDVDLSFSAPTTVLSVNGVADGRAFGAGLALGALTLDLASGANPVALVLDAGAGPFEFSFTFFRVDSFGPPRFTSPASGEFTNQASLPVVGTVPVGTPFVEVNGVAADIAADGVTFTATVPLAEGSNALTSVAFPSGASNSIQVSLDTVPPVFAQLLPRDGVVTPESEIALAGVVDEPVALLLTGPGGVLSGGANVPLGLGIPAFPFDLGPLALLAGSNALQITATDRAGNATVADLEAIRRDLALALVDPTDGSSVPGLRTDLTVSASEPVVLDAVYAGGRRLPAFEGLSLAAGQTLLAGVPLAPGANELRLVHHRPGGSAETLVASLLSTATAADGTTVTGQVTDVDRGTGIANALVAISVGGITQVVVTDADGNYQSLVESGDIDVDATADGFAAGTFSGTGATGGTLVADVGLDGTGISSLMNEVAVLAPPDGTVTDFEEIGVVGTVLDPTSVVTVNGVPADVIGNRFIAREVPLAMGSNVLEVSANALGTPVVTTTVAVERAEEPVLDVALFSPPDEAVVPGGGLVVRGFVSAEDSVVRLIPYGVATSTDGLFEVSDIFLEEGVTAIRAEAERPDTLQTAQDEISVTAASRERAVLLSADPSAQTAPLQGQLTLGFGVTLEIERIDFDPDGDGQLDALDAQGFSVPFAVDDPGLHVPRALVTTPGGVELSAETLVQTHLPELMGQEFAQGNPVDLARGPDGSLWVLDANAGSVSHFDGDGNILGSFGSAGSGPEQMANPEAIAVASDGRIFVADTGNDRIQVYETDGTFALTFGLGSGSGPGELQDPRGLAIDGDRLYVADSGNDRVQIIGLDGVLQGERSVLDPRDLAPVPGCGVVVASPQAGLRAILDDRVVPLDSLLDLPTQAATVAPIDIDSGAEGPLIAEASAGELTLFWPQFIYRRSVGGFTRPPLAVLAGTRRATETVYVADGEKVIEVRLPVPSPIPTAEALKAAFLAGDGGAALDQIHPLQREVFTEIFTAIEGDLPIDGTAMESFEIDLLRETRAIVRIRTTEEIDGSPEQVEYPMLLVRGEGGEWRIYDF